MNVETIKYETTKEACQAKIDETGFVCSRCGGERVPIETVDNADNPTFWPGCKACERFDYGVSPMVYEIAKRMVDEKDYTPYSFMDAPKGDDEYKKYYRECQIGGVIIIVLDVLKIRSQIIEKILP